MHRSAGFGLLAAAMVVFAPTSVSAQTVNQCVAQGQSTEDCLCASVLMSGSLGALARFQQRHPNADTLCNAMASTALTDVGEGDGDNPGGERGGNTPSGDPTGPDPDPDPEKDKDGDKDRNKHKDKHKDRDKHKDKNKNKDKGKNKEKGKSKGHSKNGFGGGYSKGGFGGYYDSASRR